MIKLLEISGLVLLAVMILSFVGAFRPTVESGLSEVFWACAGGTLVIIIYRKRKRKRGETP